MIIGPAFISAIMKSCKGNMRWLKALAGGGGAISDEEEKKLNEILAKCHATVEYTVGYGMTELGATVCTNMNRCNQSGLKRPIQRWKCCLYPIIFCKV